MLAACRIVWEQCGIVAHMAGVYASADGQPMWTT